jgi:hypothetical protein
VSLGGGTVSRDVFGGESNCKVYHCPQKSVARVPAAFSRTARATVVNFMVVDVVRTWIQLLMSLWRCYSSHFIQRTEYAVKSLHGTTDRE